MPNTQKRTSKPSQDKVKTIYSAPINPLRTLVGTLMIVAGIITLTQQLTGYSVWQYSWPFILIIAGIFIVRRWK